MFKTPLKIILAASVAMPAILAADLAQAGHKKKRHYNAHKSYNHHYKRGHRGYSRGHHGAYYGHKYRRSYRSHYYPSYYYGGYHGGRHYYRHGHRGSKVGTYASLALLGAALGVIIHNNSKNRDYDRGYSNQRNYTPQQPYQGGYAAPENRGGFDFSQCVETRDYETTILVEGQEQLAYGTACMYEDGSWVAGPMRIGN